MERSKGFRLEALIQGLDSNPYGHMQLSCQVSTVRKFVFSSGVRGPLRSKGSCSLGLGDCRIVKVTAESTVWNAWISLVASYLLLISIALASRL